jgi:hypothetical protein
LSGINFDGLKTPALVSKFAQKKWNWVKYFWYIYFTYFY